MNAAEKLRFAADRIDDGKEFEMKEGNMWVKVRYKQMTSLGVFKSEDISAFSTNYGVVGIRYLELSDLVNYDIRTLPKFPQLTQEEKDWLKYHPQDWWIARDGELSFESDIYIYANKPDKGERGWNKRRGNRVNRLLYRPNFAEIKWSDEDCFTIGELRK